MKAGRAIVGYAAAAAGAAIAISVLLGGSGTGVPLAAYLAAIGGLGIVQSLRWPGVRWRIDNRPVPTLLPQRKPQPPSGTPGAVIELEGLLAEGAHSARAADRRLRPRLAEAARAWLLHRHGIRMDDDPAAAAALLGPIAWPLVRPPQGPSESARTEGIDPADVEVLVRVLEQS